MYKIVDFRGNKKHRISTMFLLKYLFLVTDKPEVNYLSIPAIRLQNGKCEIRHILRDELELPKEV